MSELYKAKRLAIGDIVIVLGLFEYEIIGFDEVHYQCKRIDNGDIHWYDKEKLTPKSEV